MADDYFKHIERTLLAYEEDIKNAQKSFTLIDLNGLLCHEIIKYIKIRGPSTIQKLVTGICILPCPVETDENGIEIFDDNDEEEENTKMTVSLLEKYIQALVNANKVQIKTKPSKKYKNKIEQIIFLA